MSTTSGHTFQEVPLEDTEVARDEAVTTVGTDRGEGWCQRTKRCFAQRWKKKDVRFTSRSAMLRLPMATAALLANLVGMGMVAMPYAFAGIGWTAILVVPLFATLAVFNSCLLNSCCAMLEERCKEYRKFHWYTQYSDVASKALGPGVGRIVSGLRLLSVAGLQAVVIVLTAEAITDFVLAFLPISLPHGQMYCVLVVGLGATSVAVKGPCTEVTRYWCSVVHLPLSLSLLGLLLAGLADSFFGPGQWSRVVGSSIDPLELVKAAGYKQPDADHESPQRSSFGERSAVPFFVGLGVIVFNFASVSGFTNVRRDMAEPSNFNRAASYSVAGYTAACLLIGVMGYAAFGVLVNGNVIMSLNSEKTRVAAHIMLSVSYMPMANLISFTLEEYDKAEDHVTVWRRAKLASPLMAWACVMALVVPQAGPLMALVGSLFVCPVTFVLPPILYAGLCRGSPQWPERPLSRNMKIALVVALVTGLAVHIGGTVTAIMQIVHESQTNHQSCFRGFCYEGHYAHVPPPVIYTRYWPNVKLPEAVGQCKYLL
uniref:Amino acid transporter n=1 Tax=Rhipicephalus zambeziensis TaxID=60191 RepID=A0A224YTG0_9ACAR